MGRFVGKAGVGMGFFDWSAPLFAAFGDRWSGDRIEEIASYLRPSLPARGGVVLDLGGGTGVLSARLAQRLDARFVVADPTTAMTRYVPENPRIETVNAPAEGLPFPDGHFDAVIISDAFHHFPDQEGAVREIVRVVKQGGAVIMLEFDARRRLVRWTERIADPRGHLFSPASLCDFLAARGIAGSCQSRGPVEFDFVGRVS